METYIQRTGVIYANANSAAIDSSHKDQNSISVVRLDAVYGILEKMYCQYEAELQKMNDFYQNKFEALKSQENKA